MAKFRQRHQALVGKRVCFTGMGFTLLTEGPRLGTANTLWRPTKGKVCGEIVSVQPKRFYQQQENVAWLKIKLDKARGRFKYAQGYFDETTGRMLSLRHEPARLLPPKRDNK